LVFKFKQMIPFHAVISNITAWPTLDLNICRKIKEYYLDNRALIPFVKPETVFYLFLIYLKVKGIKYICKIIKAVILLNLLRF